MTPTFIVKYCFNPPSWQGWMKFFEIDWNWSLLPITFLISLSSIYNRTIGLNDLEELYEALLGLEMIMELDILECNS